MTTAAGELLRVAVLGAFRRKGRKIGSAELSAAHRVADAWNDGPASAASVAAILSANGLHADEVLPANDADMAEVLRLGRAET